MSESSTPLKSFSDSAKGELDLSELYESLLLIESSLGEKSVTKASSESTESLSEIENNSSSLSNNCILNSNSYSPSTSKLSYNHLIKTSKLSNNINTQKILKMSSTPSFDIKNLNIISPFDGNPCELYNYLKISQTFLTIYYDETDPGCMQNLLLFEGIKSRLIGRAREVISIYGASTWDEVKAVLTQNFGDQRDENSLNRDLVNLKQTNESPQQFYEKVMSLLNIICNYIEIHNTDDSIKISKKNFFTQQALVTFLAGLREPLGSTIRAMRPKDLATAMQFIVEENNIRYLQKSHIFNNPNNPPIFKKPVIQQRPQQQNNFLPNNNTPRFMQPNFQPQYNNHFQPQYNNNFQPPKFPTGPINIQPRTNYPPQRFPTNQQTFKNPQNVWKPGQNTQRQQPSTPMSTSTRNTFRRPQNQYTGDFRAQPGPSSKPNFSEQLFNIEHENTQEISNNEQEYQEYTLEHDENQEYQEVEDYGNFQTAPDPNYET